MPCLDVRPRKVFSDNGTNFVGAFRKLTEMQAFIKRFDASMNDLFSNEGISCSFIPAHSLNFGGLWEVGVKAVKHHLTRVMAKELLTY